MVEIPAVRKHEVVDEDIAIPPPALLRRVSWGAILAGTVVAIGIYVLFGLLGLALGLGAIDPMDSSPLSGIGTGTIVWWVVTSIVALAVGGFTGGRLAGIPRGLSGMLHGLAIWALVAILSLWLATSAIGKIVNMAASVVVTAAQTAVSAASTIGGVAVDAGGAAMPDDAQLREALRQQGLTREQVRREAAEITRAAGLTQQDAQAAQNALGKAARDIVTTPGDAGEDINQLIDRLFGGPGAVISDQERQRLVQEISSRAGISPQQAEQIANRWQQQASTATNEVTRTAEQARQRAGEISASALDGLSKAAWGAFIASLISLIAALVGSALGAPHDALSRGRMHREHE
ncbi:MAG TPA: hypothetical protein VGR19_09815 [Allosphingosinicella sp.]|nr:hypothetical protein [Allosphingosinicella sp.]